MANEKKNKTPKTKNFGGKRSAASGDEPLPTKKKRVSFDGSVSEKKSKSVKQKPLGTKKSTKNGLKPILKEQSASKNKENKGDVPSAEKTGHRENRSFRVGKNAQGKLDVMSRKERKIYLKKLQAKRKPNFDLSQRAKQIWEKLRK